jgi:predicted nucleotidyltransferase
VIDEDTRWALDTVCQALNDKNTQVYLFGSRANNSSNTHSDIDIALLANVPISLFKLAELRDTFEQSHLLVSIDLVDLNQVDEAFKAKVLKDGIKWND